MAKGLSQTNPSPLYEANNAKTLMEFLAYK